MNVQTLLNLNIVAVRFSQDGNLLTSYQFISWCKLNSSETSSEDALEIIAAANAEPVYNQDPPAINSNQFAEWDGAIQIDGRWVRNWKIVEAPDKQALISASKLADLRRERNALLLSSDWTQFNDSPLTAPVKEQWAAYRQQLRDITKQNIDAIVWPTPPTGS